MRLEPNHTAPRAPLGAEGPAIPNRSRYRTEEVELSLAVESASNSQPPIDTETRELHQRRGNRRCGHHAHATTSVAVGNQEHVAKRRAGRFSMLCCQQPEAQS